MAKLIMILFLRWILFKVQSQLFYNLLQGFQICLNGIPEYFNVTPKILMDKFISHPGNFLPGYFRIFLSYVGRYFFNSFTNHLQTSNDCILRFFVFLKFIDRHVSSEIIDIINCLNNIVQIVSQLSFHNNLKDI